MPIEKANVILVRWISSRSELRRRSHPKGVGRPEYGNANKRGRTELTGENRFDPFLPTSLGTKWALSAENRFTTGDGPS
jgi:hypothetical protein